MYVIVISIHNSIYTIITMHILDKNTQRTSLEQVLNEKYTLMKVWVWLEHITVHHNVDWITPAPVEINCCSLDFRSINCFLETLVAWLGWHQIHWITCCFVANRENWGLFPMFFFQKGKSTVAHFQIVGILDKPYWKLWTKGLSIHLKLTKCTQGRGDSSKIYKTCRICIYNKQHDLVDMKII